MRMELKALFRRNISQIDAQD